MTISKNYAGAWVLSDVVNERLVTKTYYGYTKAEAVAMFNAEKGKK